MAQSLPINAADYYEFFPQPEHRVGDIWVDLPSFGMFGIEHVTGIVITPACDLQNCKAETITYIPIVPIRQAFVLRGFLPAVIREINGQVQALGIDDLDDSAGPFILMEPTHIDALIARIKEKTGGRNVSEKDKAAAKRAIAGVTILRKGYGLSVTAASGLELKTLFGASNFDKLVERIVTNSYRTDMHFFPSDTQRPEWSAISEHSVALFRYVFSAPIEIFDCAQDLSRAEWGHEIRRMSSCAAGVASFGARRPMKRQTLKSSFAADLLTRYIAMHVRLGAPDFTSASIKAYVADVVGENK